MKPNLTSTASRREFLRRASTYATLGAAGPMALNLAALGSAAAQSASDYKAIVCVFLFGGNDAYNMVLPTDAASWQLYQAARQLAPDSIALLAPGIPANLSAAAGSPARLGGVLPLNSINGQGRGIALHPVMSGVRDVFAAGRLAVLPNIGPLIRPITKAEYRDSKVPKPPKLFSHNDQVSTWQSGGVEGATAGWGGRMGDLLASNNSTALFTSISTSGKAVWLAGQQVMQYQVSSQGALRVAGSGNSLYGSTVVMDKLRGLMRNARSSDLLALDHAAVVGRSMDAEALLSSALPPAATAPFGTPGLANGAADPLLQYDNPLTGAKATNNLAQQLQVVARMIAARQSLGVKRQVFFVSMGGFDTHDGQNRQQADLLARLSHALAYFDASTQAMGLGQQVTTFTASDFGRTFTSNGDGTDHGWGSHHLVMGGAVKGRDLYGTFPTFGASDGRGDFTSPHQLGNGSLLPQTSVDQLGATLAQWFGLSASQALEVFPNLANFDAGRRHLGFI